MSGDVVKEFLVSLGLDVKGQVDFDNAVGKATLAVAGLGAAVFAVAGGIFAFTTKVAAEFDQLGDTASRIDSTAQSLQELGYVATLSGSGMDQSTASAERLAKVMGDTAMGVGKGKKVFEDLGINVKDTNGKLKNSVDMLWEVGDAIKDMERGQQTAVLQRLGIDKTLIDTLTGDASALRQEFKRVYADVGLDADEAAEKSGKLMDAIDRLGFVTGAVGKSLAVQFMSRFTDGIDRLRKLIVDHLPQIMAAIKPVIAVVLTLADVFISLAYRAGQAAGVLIGWVMDIVGAMDGWVIGIGAVVAAWKYLNLAFLASPVGIIIALTTALGLLIDDFMTWKEGGDSLIPWSEWENEINMVMGIVETLRTVLELMFTYVFATVDALVKLFSGDFTGAFMAVQVAVESLAGILSTVFGPALDMVKEQFAGAFEWIESIIDGTIGKVTGAIDWVKNAADSISNAVSLGGPMGQTLQPSPSFNGGGASQTVSQETTIVVQGSSDPAATGRAVQGLQSQVNGDMVRNLKGATR